MSDRRNDPSGMDSYDSGNDVLLDAVVRALLLGQRVFLTGAAGTGKTFLVKRIARRLEKLQQVVQVTAATGIAASLLFDEIGANDPKYIRGPATLHSAAILPWTEYEDEERLIDSGRNRLASARVVIVDEVSMLDATTLSRFFQRLPDGRGVLAVGDFYQLPPVASDDDGTPHYAFRADEFRGFRLLELSNVYRQQDRCFLDFLHALRRGECRHEFFHGIPREFDSQHPVLFGTRREAAAHNKAQLFMVNTTSHACPCKVTAGSAQKAMKWFKTYTRASDDLEIKLGMRVLCIQNMRLHNCYLVNGDLGAVVGVSASEWQDSGPEHVEIQWDRVGTMTMSRHRFQKTTMRKGQKVVVYEVMQFPFVAAYGLTVHKAQGLTLDCVNIDGARVNFAAGQVYVAMSRCREKSGLRVRNSSMFEAFTRPMVQEYYSSAPRFDIA